MPTIEMNGTTPVSRMSSNILTRGLPCSEDARRAKRTNTRDVKEPQRRMILSSCRGSLQSAVPGLGPGTWGHAHDALVDEALQTPNALHGCDLPHRMAPTVVYVVSYLVQGALGADDC